MLGKVVVLSDIHANLTALQAVVSDFQEKYRPDAIALLGDLINYGMRPNEVIGVIQQLKERYQFICNLYGNHEYMLDEGGSDRLSSDRGRDMFRYTTENLTEESMRFIQQEMESRSLAEVLINGLSVLFVHGDIEDPPWGVLSADKIRDQRYSKYDFVISGHTHIPLMATHFFSTEDVIMRNKKRTVFLNPGSVGQPRNHNNRAQYLYVDFETEDVNFHTVEYNIGAEQDLYNDQVPSFYRDRLILGV